MQARSVGLFIAIWLGSFVVISCAKAGSIGYQTPQVDEAGFEQAGDFLPFQSFNKPPPLEAELAKAAADRTKPQSSLSAKTARRIEINEAQNLRFERAGTLEFKAEIPPGSVIEIPANFTVRVFPFRDTSGNLRRSSSGFIHPVKVISVPLESEIKIEELSALNATAGGLYIFASIIGEIEGQGGNFAALKGTYPDAEYLTLFEPSGRPRFNRQQRLEKKFGNRLNRATSGVGSQAELDKWKLVYMELVKVANREIETPRGLLMISREEAIKWSKELDRTGRSPSHGAWTIAVTATAPRHGFPNVPCAEFASEVVREAYVRAGLAHGSHFNRSNKNELIWHSTAGVEGLTRALFRAGWVPWATQTHRPPIGAIMMNGLGESPGHAFIAAGRDGRFIVDNGSPQGRDLGRSRAKVLRNMYASSVFFLPPGIQPQHW